MVLFGAQLEAAQRTEKVSDGKKESGVGGSFLERNQLFLTSKLCLLDIIRDAVGTCVGVVMDIGLLDIAQFIAFFVEISGFPENIEYDRPL